METAIWPAPSAELLDLPAKIFCRGLQQPSPDGHSASDSCDHVVIASHSDQALAMLSDADKRERIHGSCPRLHAQRRAAEHGVGLFGGRVLLLCCPRRPGLTFNPLSVYSCFCAEGRLAWMIYERLWLKGARLQPRPDSAPANAVGTALASRECHDYTKPALPKSALIQ